MRLFGKDTGAGSTLHQMEALDSTGHTKTTWDPEKPDEVAAARAQFDSLVAKGYRAFTVKRNGEQDEVMRKFDPKEAAMILVPAIQGG